MPIEITSRLVGLEQARANLQAIRESDRAARTVAAIIYRQANQIIGVSQRLCPVLTGNLQASGHVRVPTFDGPSRVRVVFGYGGPAAPYAIYVHENLTARHTNGVAKFLEIPYLHFLAGSLDDFANELRAASILGRGLRAAA